MRFRLLVPLLLTATASTACASGWGGTDARPGDGGVEISDGATVVTGAVLHESTGSVLRAIMGRVPNMKVEFAGLQRCPAIALRRFEEIHGRNFPDVYLDGTRTHDTCILESIPAYDLDRVEIYPAGFTKRPGYATSTHGLILLFSRRAEPERDGR